MNRLIFTILFSFLTIQLYSSSEAISKDTLKYINKLDENIKYDVILLGGQSNMLGVGHVAELDDVYLPTNVTYLNYGLCSNLLEHPYWFGPEVGLARVLKKKFPERNFLLIKYAIGGSSLYDWSPNYDPDKSKLTSHPEFGNLFDSFINRVDSLSQIYNFNIIGMLWMQGEEDSKKTEVAEKYLTNFMSLINSFREEVNTPNLPFIFGAINPPISKFPAANQVRAAQIRVLHEIKDTYIIETSDLSKRDSVHYDTEGLLKLGARFGECLVKLIEGKCKN